MTDVIIENIVKIIAALLMMLISVGGAYLTSLIARNEKLKSIGMATQQIIDAALQTAGELQQTMVDDLKEASADGKLSKEDIATLGRDVVELTLLKLTQPTKDLINGAGGDIEAIIHGATEAWLEEIKRLSKD
jgi:hypothetical protein